MLYSRDHTGYQHIYPSIYAIKLSIYLHASIYPLVCPSINRSIFQSTNLYIHIFIFIHFIVLLSIQTSSLFYSRLLYLVNDSLEQVKLWNSSCLFRYAIIDPSNYWTLWICSYHVSFHLPHFCLSIVTSIYTVYIFCSSMSWSILYICIYLSFYNFISIYHIIIIQKN